jgi:hypothetical protein
MEQVRTGLRQIMQDLLRPKESSSLKIRSLALILATFLSFGSDRDFTNSFPSLFLSNFLSCRALPGQLSPQFARTR